MARLFFLETSSANGYGMAFQTALIPADRNFLTSILPKREVRGSFPRGTIICLFLWKYFKFSEHSFTATNLSFIIQLKRFSYLHMAVLAALEHFPKARKSQ